MNSNYDKNKGNRKKFYVFSKKFCFFCKEKISYIDYKDYKLLEKSLLENGRIKPGRATGTCLPHQKQLAMAVKRSRHMGFLKFSENKKGD